MAMRDVRPAATFDASRDAIRAAIARDAADERLAPTGLPRLYEHGGAIDKAVVLFHGFTNAPEQFDEFARALHARGANVYVPRIPRHGFSDRLTRDLGDLTVAEVQACATDAYAAARGLGRTVGALGLSLGASMALWLGQTQPLERAIAVAPFFMPMLIPRGPGLLMMHLIAALPDAYVWWDPRVRAECKPDYAYPGFPTRALATMVFAGDACFALAKTAAPARCILVTNDREAAVNNGVARALFGRMRRAGSAVDGVVLSGLGERRHDIIDPTTFPAARTLVYPKLAALLLDP